MDARPTCLCPILGGCKWIHQKYREISSPGKTPCAASQVRRPTTASQPCKPIAGTKICSTAEECEDEGGDGSEAAERLDTARGAGGRRGLICRIRRGRRIRGIRRIRRGGISRRIRRGRRGLIRRIRRGCRIRRIRRGRGDGHRQVAKIDVRVLVVIRGGARRLTDLDSLRARATRRTTLGQRMPITATIPAVNHVGRT